MPWHHSGGAITLNGNPIDQDDSNWLGTRDNTPLRIITENGGGLNNEVPNPAAEVMRITTAAPAAPARGRSVGIGTTAPQAKLDVMGDIRAGNSDIYFTRTDHNHTGIGNTAGFAAIENAANYDALMILGRAGTSRGRYVRLWDYLQVNGGMDVTGNVGIGTTGPQGKLDVRGDIRAGNSDVYFTRTDHNHTGIGNTAGFAAIENAANYDALMILGRAGTSRGRYVRLWDYLQVNGGMDVTGNVELLSASNPIRVSSGWTAFPDPVTNKAEISNDTGTYKTLMIVGNRSAGLGRRVSVWDRLEVNGNLVVTGSAAKPGGGSWSSTSDIRLKKSVKSLKGALGKLLQLRGVSFEWKEPEKQGNLVGAQMGLVAQEVEEVFPEWVDTDEGGYKNLTVRGFEALTIEAFKELKADNEALRSRIEALEGA
jgi:hypothetical protein